MPRLHLGINTCFAVKRWPEPEQWLAIVKNELGLHCCQFSLDLVDPLLDESATAAYAGAVKAYAEAHGILLHSTFTGLAAYSWSQLLHPDEAMREAAMRWYERAINFTAVLGAPGTGGHNGALTGRHSAHQDLQHPLIPDLQDRRAHLIRCPSGPRLQFPFLENITDIPEERHT